ncbi:S41 family peptidase [Caulobacter segnis]|uniref:S41 family peptidase n=1 Tax=Caulobacter segnis TaxID=88688 RepID=UPI001CBF99AF|nr:S41 family peptidase [Caulobacter segnis]UAL11407.1 DPP IV N-terminal domain-containing protein [Caulobacter segnis]
MGLGFKALLGAVSAVALGVATSSSALAAQALPSFAEPALSPDGGEIAFASGGDLWTVPAAGGQARLLVTDEATESRPLYAPDGKSLAFVSTRSGVANLYVLTLATGEVRRLTFGDSPETLDGWSRDGKWIYFTSGVNDVARQGDIFRVAALGGTPLEVSRERYLNEYESAPSPDGRSVALVARGLSNQQWWRNGHSHIDESEVWLKPIDGSGYQKLLPSSDKGGGAKRAWPMWSPDGKALWYMSDEGGTENLWRLPLGGQPQQVTRFTDGRVLWPTIGYDGRTIVFERDFAVWRLDTASGQATKVAIALHGAPAAAGESHKNETSFDALALSPDGKKAAIVAHGELFAVSTKDGGAAQRVTRTPILERDPVWSPDSKRLIYVSERDRSANIYAYDFATGQETALTTGGARNTVPTWSPDGKVLAYVRDGKEVRALTFDPTGKVASDRVLFSGALGGFDDTPLTWSPDSRWVAFTVTDRKAFDNVNVVSLDGGAARPVTFLANGQVGKVAWSPDGKYLLVDMGQRSEDAKILRVDLLPNVPKYREDAFRDLFKPADAPDKPAPGPDSKAEPAKAETPPKPVADAKPAAPKKKVEPVRIVFDGLRERATYLPLGMDVGDPLISPDGKTLVFRARQAGQTNFYTWNLDELAKEPPVPVQLTSTRKPKGDIAFTPDSKEVWFLEGGTIVSSPIDQPKPKPLAANAELDVDFDVEKTVVFEQAWGILNRGFYDPKFHGANWEQLRQRWEPYIAGTRTGDELRRNINLMIGELNASHSGINKPADPAAPMVRAANLGLRFDRGAAEAGKGLLIREVIALGPAALEGSIKPGETLVAVNGETLSPGVNLDKLLRGAAGKRTVLTVADPAGKSREAIVRPVSTATATGLLYRQWVNDRRAYVDKVSGGQLGYVHIADMSDAALAQLYIDLDAQNQGKQGVVIDVRNNNGGYVNGHVLDVFARRNYLMMTPRDRFPVPSRQNLGQRALGLPTVLVTNESSLSDAEDFTEGYRSLGLGKVVGKPTAGWIIFTGGRQLIDGSVVRLPFIRIDDLRGQNMELNPRPVDLDVDRPLGEAGDAQLDAAVKVLLGR